jgi:LVIVD repeat-containing protein
MRSILAVAAIAAALAVPAAASANHASPNMRLVTTLFKPGDLSPPEGVLASANSDLAFWGTRAYAGHYNGFRIFDISDPAHPEVLSDFACRGAQHDVSVWQNRLMFLSVDEPQLQPEGQPRGVCSEAAPATDAGREIATNFEGIRIFDVTDPRNPVFVKGVDTDCGSHTHTLVPDLRNDRLLLYVSSYPLRVGPVCGPRTSGRDNAFDPSLPVDVNPLLEQISVVEVPLGAPQNARVITEPKLAHPVYNISQIDPEATGFYDSVGCHDIGVFLEIKLAAAACMSNGQLWDISDPANPKTLPAQGARYVDVPQVEFWHSAAFTWDGRNMQFGDERIREGGCETTTEPGGRLYFYETANFSQPVGSFMIPRPQNGEYCSSHLWNVLPRKDGRYVLAEAWYNGGVDVIDFTDPTRAFEVGYYDPFHPSGDEAMWSAYWYNRFIYANDIERGQDVYLLRDRLNFGNLRFDHLNPQTQERLIKGKHSGSGVRAAPRGTARSNAAVRAKPPRGRAYDPVLREIAP